MYRRKVTISAAALFAIGAAFGAQPISERSVRNTEYVRERAPWVPGTNMLMSAHDSGVAPLAPPP